VNPVAAAIFQVCLAVGFTALGVAILVMPARWAEEFRKLGEVTFGRRVSNTVYTPGNLKWGAVGFVIIGPIIAVSGIVRLVGAASGS
jgi:hypothetical protein